MRNKDWTLVFFTVLSQLSVGIVWVLCWLVVFRADSRFLNLLGPQPGNPVLLALLSVGVATCISFLHLGKPSNAPKSMSNLPGSWVSREILALGLFTLNLMIILALGWSDRASESLRYLLLTGSVFGIGFLWAMTRIYTIRTIPPWNSWYTPLSFISTAVCLGLVTVLVLHLTVLVKPASAVSHAVFLRDPASQILMVALGLALLVELVSGILQQRRLARMNTGVVQLALDRGDYYRIFLIRMVLLALSILLLAMLRFRIYLDIPHAWVNYPLLAVVVSQALIGRLLFFSSYFRLGV